MSISQTHGNSGAPLVFSEMTMAYLKPVATPQGTGFAVYNASGEQLAVFKSRDEAFFAAKQHDLEPVLVH